MIIKYTITCVIILNFLCQAQQTIDSTLTHADVHREYLMYIPATYSDDTPSALLINFHGLNQRMEEFIRIADFRAIADSTGIILVYPQGLPSRRDGNSRWNCGNPHDAADDIGFIGALIDTISAIYNIDGARVYASGYSNGGYMCQAVACFLSDRIAAIAPVKGSMRSFTPFTGDPHHPTAVLMINNVGDEKITYEGTPENLAIPEVIQYWVNYNNCDPDANTIRLDDIDEDDGIEVDHIIYSGGDNGVNVELLLELVNINDMRDDGHFYPKSSPRSPWYFDSPTEVWQFLSKYDINGLIDPDEIEFSDESENLEFRLMQIFPNPFNQSTSFLFNLKSPGNVRLAVYDFHGCEVAVLHNKMMSAGSHFVNLTAFDLPSGVYFSKLSSNNTVQICRMVLLK